MDGKSHRVMEIVQGNLMEAPTGFTGGIEYIAHRGASRVQHRAWDLDGHAGYYEFVDGTWQEVPGGIPALTSFETRRWNFDGFDAAH